MAHWRHHLMVERPEWQGMERERQPANGSAAAGRRSGQVAERRRHHMPLMDGDGCRLVMDAPGDGDMPLMAGDGEEPMFMLMVMPPSGMLWGTGTHPLHPLPRGTTASRA